MPSTIPCPKCNEYAFHKSHTRNLYERLRKRLLRQQTYRCHSCGYRGWIRIRVLKPRPTFRQLLIYLLVFMLAILVSLGLKRLLR